MSGSDSSVLISPSNQCPDISECVTDAQLEADPGPGNISSTTTLGPVTVERASTNHDKVETFNSSLKK